MRRSLRTLYTIVILLAPLTVLAADYPKVRIETTAGAFVVELDDARAPLTVANFLKYVDDDFYTGTIFHRVINGFVIQAGGFTVKQEPKKGLPPIANESGNGLSNQRMTIAMARANDPHSGDSQFYINLGENIALDPKPTRWGYAVFGQVVEGEDVVDDIGHRATSPQGEFQNLPAAPVIIERTVLLTD